LAKALFARPSSAGDVGIHHGVDLILGGHDHLYYVSKGCENWEGYDLPSSVPLGTEEDDGVLVIKSGTDFRDLSELTLELEDGPPDAVRRKLVKTVTGGMLTGPSIFIRSSAVALREEVYRHCRDQIFAGDGQCTEDLTVFGLFQAWCPIM
jgi:hypothetical protein